MLDVKRMVLLRDLAEHGRVTAVADLHGVTPSAVSQQLRALEAEAGAGLVEREGRGLRLTPAGTALAAACEPVLAALERAEAAVRALDAEPSGELAVGCAPSALATVAAPLVAELGLRHPGLRPRLVQCDPEDALPLLRGRRLDLAVTYAYPLLGAPPAPGTTAVPLFADPLCLALPEALLPAYERTGLGALRDRAWVSAPAPSSCREMLLHACRGAGFTPYVAHACADLRSGLALVATGRAVSILPKLLCDAPPPGAVVRELPGPGRTFQAVVRAGTEARPAVAATLAALRVVVSGR
ncbi:LysR family transcriptional regulator [Streptomyces subrutilus]|uniref:LysR family transcriptional regulator n=1 Tax=Streptomyces subrutilus TaxID=36818 RepID=A0A5P2UJ41_9ACTN|nr:LysR family transcriptional regulator [Streptomyces subrutilus]QEU79182.1 LysR family transcriptional regulator [Streptomyces subrutilus]WSJ31629.1 LysR family transcriptional regulator [Streptomyces subrutilus]GGZ52507.1 LysR family transcriptional regulator [Streptomyces subrutilus]